jgi:hypothetical protein
MDISIWIYRNRYVHFRYIHIFIVIKWTYRTGYIEIDIEMTSSNVSIFDMSITIYRISDIPVFLPAPKKWERENIKLISYNFLSFKKYSNHVRVPPTCQQTSPNVPGKTFKFLLLLIPTSPLSQIPLSAQSHQPTPMLVTNPSENPSPPLLPSLPHPPSSYPLLPQSPSLLSHLSHKF